MRELNNPNIAQVIVERVPCCFAKPGGTHYTKVLLDKHNNLLYVASECEEKIGPGIQLFHENGSETCFSITANFRAILKEAQPGVSIEMRATNVTLTPMLTASYQVRDRVRNTHNARLPVVEDEYISFKQRALENVINRVAETVTNHGPLFSVYQPMDDHFCLTVRGYGLNMANRDAGVWVIDEKAIYDWAYKYAGPHPGLLGNSWVTACHFCDQKFERLGQHLVSAAHVEQVLQVVKLATMATSSKGLKLYGNPKYHTLFTGGK